MNTVCPCLSGGIPTFLYIQHLLSGNRLPQVYDFLCTQTEKLVDCGGSLRYIAEEILLVIRHLRQQINSECIFSISLPAICFLQKYQAGLWISTSSHSSGACLLRQCGRRIKYFSAFSIARTVYSYNAILNAFSADLSKSYGSRSAA